MSSIITGINNSSVQRIRDLWQDVDEKKIEKYEYYMEMSENFKNYREFIRSCGNLVPFLPLHLKDIFYCMESNDLFSPSKKTEKHLINFSSMKVIGESIHNLVRFQNTLSFSNKSEEIVEFLLHLECLGEDKLLSKSLEIRPTPKKDAPSLKKLRYSVSPKKGGGSCPALQFEDLEKVNFKKSATDIYNLKLQKRSVNSISLLIPKDVLKNEFLAICHSSNETKIVPFENFKFEWLTFKEKIHRAFGIVSGSKVDFIDLENGQKISNKKLLKLVITDNFVQLVIKQSLLNEEEGIPTSSPLRFSVATKKEKIEENCSDYSPPSNRFYVVCHSNSVITKVVTVDELDFDWIDLKNRICSSFSFKKGTKIELSDISDGKKIANKKHFMSLINDQNFVQVRVQNMEDLTCSPIITKPSSTKVKVFFNDKEKKITVPYNTSFDEFSKMVCKKFKKHLENKNLDQFFPCFFKSFVFVNKSQFPILLSMNKKLNFVLELKTKLFHDLYSF